MIRICSFEDFSLICFVRLISVTLCVIFSTPVVAQNSKVDGLVYFVKPSGDRDVYPWPSSQDRIKKSLVYSLKNNGRPAFLRTGPEVEFIDDPDYVQLAEYTLIFGTKRVKKLPVTVVVEFVYGRYYGASEVQIDQHGTVIEQLHVDFKETFRTDDAQKVYIQELSDRVTKPSAVPVEEIDDTYLALRGYLSSNTELKHFLLIVEFVREIVGMQNELDPRFVSWPSDFVDGLRAIEDNAAFLELPDDDQFRLLTDLALVLTTAKNGDFVISPGTRIRDLAKQYYLTASELALVSDSTVKSTAVGRKMQHAYEFMCNEAGPEFQIDCAYTLFDLVNSDRTFSRRTMRNFFSDFAFYVVKFSSLPDLKSLSSDWKLTVSQEPDLLELWTLYLDACFDESGTAVPLVKRSANLKLHCEIAREIVQLSTAQAISNQVAGN